MATQRSSVRIKIGANTTQFKMAMRGVRATVTRLAMAVKAAMLPVAALMGAISALTGVIMVRGIKAVIKLGADLDHLSRQTGISVSQLMVLRQAFEDAGVSGDQVGKAINKMQKVIIDAGYGLTTYTRAFENIGVNYRDIAKLTPLEQFNAITKGLAEQEDQTKRSAAALDIFGARVGGKLMPMFLNPDAVDDARESLGRLPEIMERTSAAFERIDTIMGRVKTKMHGIFAPIVERFLPEIERFMDTLNLFDFTKVGDAIADVIAKIGTAFKQGTVFDLIQAAFMVAITNAMSYAGAAFVGAVKGLLNVLGNLFANFPQYAEGFVSVFKAGWHSMLAMLTSTMNLLIGAFEDVLVNIVSALRAMMPAGKRGAMTELAKKKGFLDEDGKITSAGLSQMSKMAQDKLGYGVNFSRNWSSDVGAGDTEYNRNVQANLTAYKQAFGMSSGGTPANALMKALLQDPQSGFAAVSQKQSRGQLDTLQAVLSGEVEVEAAAASEAWAKGAASRKQLYEDSGKLLADAWADAFNERSDGLMGTLAEWWKGILGYEWASLDPRRPTGTGKTPAAGGALGALGAGAAGLTDPSGAVVSSFAKIGGGGNISFARLSTTDTILSKQLEVQKEIRESLSDDLPALVTMNVPLMLD